MVLVGDAGVGKSSVLLRFTEDNYEENYMATLGVDFEQLKRFKNVEIKRKKVKLQLWDTAGQERFRTVTNTYFKNSQAVLGVYDMTSRESFDNLRDYWVNEVRQHADANSSFFIIGNKFDLEQEITVDHAEVQQLALQENTQHFEVSAKTSQHLVAAFMQMAEVLIDKNVAKQTQLTLDQPTISPKPCTQC